MLETGLILKCCWIQVDIVEEDPQNSGSRGNVGGSGAYQRFWKALGAPVNADGDVVDVEVKEAGSPSEDEQFESAMVATNSVWEVDPAADRLIPSDQYWGAIPQFDMLQPKKVNIHHLKKIIIIKKDPSRITNNPQNIPDKLRTVKFRRVGFRTQSIAI